MLERPIHLASLVPPALVFLLAATAGCDGRRPDPAAIGLTAPVPGRPEGGRRAAAGLRPEGNGGVLPQWAAVAAMPGPLELQASAPLADGRVLVTGGDSGPSSALPVAYAYDVATNTWSQETPLATARELHTATLLGNGHVLVAGGYSDVNPFAADVEIYDSGAKTWAAMAMPSDHAEHTATRMMDGTVLLAGGWAAGVEGGSSVSSSVDLFDPTLGAEGGWGTSTQMRQPRGRHAACRLGDGTVLVTGGVGINGFSLGDAEIYDPKAGTWTPTLQRMNEARDSHQCALLPDGTVLVAGGENQSEGSFILASAEVYDPFGKTWTLVQPMGTARAWHQMVPIVGGQILVVGGYAGNTTVPSTEIYDPVAQSWSAGPTLHEGRKDFTLSATGNNILVTGGWDSTRKTSNGVTATAEVVNFGAPPGTPCIAASSCASSVCIGGFCCDTACTGTCMACTAQLKGGGADGTCGPVAAGTDPGHQCHDQGATSCGTNGTCDGKGACGTYPEGTVCLETTPCIVAVCAHGTCGGPNKLDGAPCPGGVCIAGGCVPDPGLGSSSSSSASSTSSTSSSTGSPSSDAGAGGSSGATSTSGQGGDSATVARLSGNGCSLRPGGAAGDGLAGTAAGLLLLGWLSGRRRRS